MGKPNFIYIGPSIPSWGLKMNTLFRGAKPPAKFLEVSDAKPVIRSLFISTKNLAEAKRKLSQKGTLEYTAVREMQAIAKTAPR